MHCIAVNDVSREPQAWQLWCRLCGKDDINHNINVFLKSEFSGVMESSGTLGRKHDLNLKAAVSKYFGVNICQDENLPKVLCSDCVSLLSALSSFSDRVAKVQQMYATLLNKDISKPSAVRDKYGILDNGWEHIFVHQRIPVVEKASLETKETVFLQNGDLLSNEILPDENPLETDHPKFNIKQENEMIPEDILDMNIDESSTFLTEEDEKDDYMVEDLNEIDNENCMSNSDSKCSSSDYPTRKAYKKGICNEEGSIEDDVELICNDCNQSFKREQNLKIHRKKKHGVDPEKMGYTCSTCHKVFDRKYSYDRHLTVHLPKSLKKVVPCSLCDKKFSAYTLRHHIKYTHMNTRFICEECGVTVKSQSALKEHMLIHTDYAPFECEICKKCFKNQYRLNRHMEIHDSNKHICAECGLQLNSKATLNRHLLVHSDVMKHKCDYCGRCFKRAKALKNHLILHTGLKPYSCDFCDRTFANGSNCRTHKKKAHPEELAALEASGGKAYTKNIPKLDALKAVTRTIENLTPVVSKQSGNFAFGKKNKTTSTSFQKSNKFMDVSVSQITSAEASLNSNSFSSIVQQNSPISTSSSLPESSVSIDNNLDDGENSNHVQRHIPNDIDNISIMSSDAQQAQVLRIEKDDQDFLSEPQQLKLFPTH